MTVNQKWEYFRMLVEIGYTEIEVSFPAASQTEFDFTRRLVETPNAIPDAVRIRGLCPTREDFLARTVEALRGAKRATVCTYICTSDKQLRYQGFTREKAVEQAARCVRYLRSLTKDDAEAAAVTEWTLAFGLESYNEADPDFALVVTEAVKEAWAPTPEQPMTVVLATSTEVSTPNVFADQVELFRASLSEPEKMRISVHPHNDRGCAVASAELALLAGARMVEGCLFGNGERCGNVDLVALALNLYTRGIHPGLDLSNLPGVRQRFERLTGLRVAQRAPYAGEFALQAFSGSHQNIIGKGVARRGEAMEQGEQPVWDIPYLPLDPEDVGIPLDHVIRVNSQSGKAAGAWVLKRRWGLDIPGELQADFGRRVQLTCEALEREISHQEVLDLFVASYAMSSAEAQASSAPADSLVIADDDTLYKVSGTMAPADKVVLGVEGSGIDIPSAVLRGLPFMKGLHATAENRHTQKVSVAAVSRDTFCALASCEEGNRIVWGCALDEDKQQAEAMAIVAAAWNGAKRRTACVPSSPVRVCPSTQALFKDRFEEAGDTNDGESVIQRELFDGPPTLYDLVVRIIASPAQRLEHPLETDDW
ncbi:2-isopropylmalate synthase 2 [Colletotrichum sidae]|uniref:2-isopropylmalate synthase n=1 Tax=Colletotrichum sidae TaxID=1347389 RepID=A0A4R8TTR3_9PEZI|nr:2-isopropylmalate synthase 2 [Colletotrichum sidae]